MCSISLRTMSMMPWVDWGDATGDIPSKTLHNVGKLCDCGVVLLVCGNIPSCWYPPLGYPLHRRLPS